MPILWLALTLGVWLAAIEIQKRSGNRVMANPVLLTIVAIGALLLACHIPYATYWQGAQAINLLLGPRPLPWPCRWSAISRASAKACAGWGWRCWRAA
jgi:putative effector of murein hydrolase